ncbi:DUF6492 family protein [Desulfobacula toluolica]|uniref:Conserved uncharacterized protein n=1 Tax=Desulfobacula toluolica (strain DSM 7467 / Tol2) TaxID=651182 RepID=K0NHW0_DESTT|nr:DUF6492 family protein [Desulfobacula toluolica]CCK79413.1 conserved uncharacterized protein [Desulfobacula toluolica Tol2]
MNKLVIFCKSYSKDLLRAKRMAQSILRFNRDNIPLYMSVPSDELELFKKTFQNLPCHFVTDEEILNNCSKTYGPSPRLFPAHLLQQLIKLEFWRLNKCEYYLWIDSDSYFLKPFDTNFFFHNDDTPLLVMHHANDLRNFALKYDTRIAEKLDNRIKAIQQLFGRKGESFYFGDPPLIWSSSVLKAMSREFLKPRGMTIYELLYRYPCEMQIYGEFVLAYNIHKIIPTEPFFKVFHYAEQFFDSQRKGESEYSLAGKYLGVVMQSNWTNKKEKKKNDMARFKKFLREQQRKLGLIRFQPF